MRFEKVVSVKYIEPRQTMDIEVNSADHIFYGNGIATSNSHAVAYAINSFASAYCKTHDPIKFYTVYLNNASSKPDKQREIKELIMDAKLQGIEVLPLDLTSSIVALQWIEIGMSYTLDIAMSRMLERASKRH
jgi:DNA polymerase III alpha subunit (gram-positive type)